jgi:hypothetical protein
MNLSIIWVSFIVFTSVFQELNLLHYLFLNFLMLWFIYLYNLVKPLEVSVRLFILLFTGPSIVTGYIAFIYNNFLIINTN